MHRTCKVSHFPYHNGHYYLAGWTLSNHFFKVEQVMKYTPNDEPLNITIALTKSGQVVLLGDTFYLVTNGFLSMSSNQLGFQHTKDTPDKLLINLATGRINLFDMDTPCILKEEP